LNAALGCAQMENFTNMLRIKQEITNNYLEVLDPENTYLSLPIKTAVSNNWLNSIVFKYKKDRDLFLEFTNKQGIMTRPVWGLMSELMMFKNCYAVDLLNSHWLAERVVNIPSSVPHL
jgi:dTDP-4-amino-4,6-dideoxygalactose transaminase